MYVSLHDFVCLFLLLPFVLGFCLFDCLGFLCFFLFFVLFFLLPFLPCHVACRGLVLCLGVGSEPPRWESQVQDIRPPKNSWPCGKLIGECSPRGLHLNTKTWLHPAASKLQCWTSYAKQLARQEHNTTH